MIQKSGAIVKAYNGEQSPLFVDLQGMGNLFISIFVTNLNSE